jgi:glutathione S-transferase
VKLYYCETINPRKACAAARYLNSSIEFVRVDLSRGEHRSAEFLALNPNGKVPVLKNGDWSLWEANAIMCYLSDEAKAEFWPHDARQIEVMRWLGWDAQHFTRHGGTLYFEYLIKPQLGMGEADPVVAAQATVHFTASARILEMHLRDRSFLVGQSLSVADFAVASALPYAHAARLPLAEYPAIQRWYARLEDLPAWRDPFPS